MEKGFLIILFLACVLLPVSPAIANILFLVFGGGIVLEGLVKKNFPPQRDWLQLLVLPSFFFLWMAIGVLFSHYKKEGLHLVEISIPFMVLSLAYIFASDSIKERARKFIPAGMVVGIVGSLLYLIFSLLINFYNSGTPNFLTIFSFEFTYFNFTNPIKSHPTYYTVWILIANYFVFTSKKLGFYSKSALLILFGVGIVFSMSRVGLFLYGLQIVSLFFLLSRKWKIVYGIGVILILLLGVYLYKYQLRNFYLLQRLSIELSWDTDSENLGSEINNRPADDSRIARWSAIWNKFEEKPIFGYGTGSERAILDNAYQENGLEIALERRYNTHNQYLFYMIEQGLVGLLILLAYFCINFLIAVKRKDFFTISFIIGIMAVLVFENYMYRSMGYLTMALFLTFMRKSKK